MVLEPVLEPIILGFEAYQYPCRAPVPRDQNLLLGSELEVPGEIILHLRQGDAARLG